MAPVGIEGKYGYIDRTGKLAIDLQFDSAWVFSEGLAPVKIGGKVLDEAGKWGYIDKRGKIVIKPRFDWAKPFSDALAAVKVQGKLGYIDKKGKMIIKPQFASALDFRMGLALVNVGGKWKTEKMAGGLTRKTLLGGKWGYIDKNGDFVWGPTLQLP